MSDASLISAPAGWADYAAGKHLDNMPASQATAETLVAWLAQLDLVDRPEALGELLPASSEGATAADWSAIESDFIGGRAGTIARPARLQQLRTKAAGTARSGPADRANWTDIVARGRVHQMIADLEIKEKSSGGYAVVNDQLDLAIHEFSKVEGRDFLVANAEIVRGKASAWRNDIARATSSLSYAMAVFRRYGHYIKEAEAAYELAMANLDIGNGDAAEALLQIAVDAYRAMPSRSGSLARALQSQARARLLQLTGRNARAFRALQEEQADESLSADVEAGAETAALEAFDIVANADVSATVRDVRPPASQGEALNQRQEEDGFRAAMAARDMAALELFRATQSPDGGHLKRAASWFKAACIAQGLGKIFDRESAPTLRREPALAEASGFNIRRLAQLEFEILAATAPSEAAPLLVEIGKLFQRHSEQNYAVECYLAAARAFKLAHNPDEASETVAPEARHSIGDARDAASAAYWRYRAQRVAHGIGYILPPTHIGLPGAEGANRERLESVVQELKATVLNVTGGVPDAVHADARLDGRREDIHLVVLGPSLAGQISLPLLQTLSERGDIPYIVEQVVREDGSAAIAHEKVSGQPLRTVLAKTAPEVPKLKIASRLCRSVAALMHAHSRDGIMASPLFITPDDIDLIPGNRCIITRYGCMFGLQEPSVGWAFLYAGLKDGKGEYRQGADAIALARIIRLLLGEQSIDATKLARGSYWRRALRLRKKELDYLSPEGVNALDNILKGKFVRLCRGRGDFAAGVSSVPPDSTPLPQKGYRELLQLAGFLDAASH